MADARLILAGEQPQGLLQTVGQGMQFGDALKKMLVGNKLAKINMLGTTEEQDAAAKNAFFAPDVTAALQANRQAKAQWQIDQMKDLAQINMNNATAGKSTAEAGEIGQKTGAARFSAALPAYQAMAQGAGVEGGLMVLGNLHKSGAIDDATYQAMSGQIEGLRGQDGEALKQFGFTAYKAGLDPKYNVQTVDNAADNVVRTNNNIRDNQTIRQNNIDTNTTSRQNNIETNATSRQNNAANIAQKNSEISAVFQQQQEAIRSGKAKLETINGVTYVDYGNGKGEVYVDKTGQPQAGQTKQETLVQKNERQEKVINFKEATKQAASSTALAASIANRAAQLKLSPAEYAIYSHIPSSDAYKLKKDIETLQSNWFLDNSSQLKGTLTDKDAMELKNALGALDPMLGYETFTKNVAKAATIFSRTAQNTRDKTWLYSTGNVAPQNATPPSAPPGAAKQSGNRPNAREFF